MPIDFLLTREREITFEEYQEIPLVANQVRVKAVMSAVSHGTEISLFRGTSPFHNKQFDPKLRLFTEATEKQAYPIRLGYEWVGRVTEVGESVESFSVGDLVHLPMPHRQTQTFVPSEMHDIGVTGPLPKQMTPEQAVFLGTTSIALQAVHDAHIKVGDRVTVFGLGVLGLLTVQLARLNGASWVDAIDPIANRRQLAESFGADRCLDPLKTDVGMEIKESSEGADVAIEFSGNYDALSQAIRSVRMGGLVVAAGFYQGGGQALRLGEEWLHNRVTMVSSSRGWGNVHRDSPMWNRARLRASAISLLADGHVQVTEMITHRIPYKRAQSAYELIDTRSPDIYKVVFVY